MATKNVKADNWDGKSRVSNDTYRKRWDEIFGKKENDELDELLALWYRIDMGWRP